MSNKRLILLALLALTLHAIGSTSANQSGEAVSVGHLRCEDRKNPMGVDRTNPLLSWWITSDQRGEKQSAYQILVASDPSILAQEKGDLWDSGKVPSDNAIQIPYQGNQLTSSQWVFWKIRA
jgi:alpha-L-rhamnosidase